MTAFRYYLIYKPYGMLSQFSDPHGGKRTLRELHAFPKDVYPIGRLDEDSEGLLILSNDGSLNKLLLGGGYEKEYWVQVEGVPDEAALEKLRRGVDIKVKGKVYRTKKAKVRALSDEPKLPDRVPPIRFRKTIPTSWLSIKIHEGKNRQVRKMTATVGYPTLRLVRVKMGNLNVLGMKVGEIKQLEREGLS